ncbi:MAG: holo-ACP synthase [Rickettsiales bacterium]|jgi:holo-[acyl-carrier protein] synthase|nr:holo-ACP synthase [Rickettsiales bacterium]
MIVGIGTDLLERARMEEMYKKFGEKLATKMLSTEELNEFKILKKEHIGFIAKRFSVKEAFSKAIGLGIGRGIDLKDITIIHNEIGQPFIKLNDKANNFLFKRYGGKINIHISMTDERSIINAVAIIEI